MACPTNQRMNVQQANDFVQQQMEKEYPLGIFRDESETAQPIVRPESDYRKETLDRILELDTHPEPEAELDPEAPTFKVKMAGFGGQGVLSMGIILARASCGAGKFVSWYPSYGPEQRGGTANCGVVISGQPIGSPLVQEADVLVALNRPSLEKFKAEVRPGGLLLYNAEIGEVDAPEGVRALAVPVVEICREGGNDRAPNIAMAGVLAALGNLGIPDDLYLEAIAKQFAGKPKVIEQNQAIFHLGKAWAERQGGDRG